MSDRSPAIRAMACIACEHERMQQPSPTEEHHLNFGGFAGQKRRGNDFSIPLCGWHHRSVLRPGVSPNDMDSLYGPSLARTSRRFRETYGKDDSLLSDVNERLFGRVSLNGGW